MSCRNAKLCRTILASTNSGITFRAETTTSILIWRGTSPQVGTTPAGDRIVVAVLEGGGSNYNHVDLIDNHWTNDAEVPGNGIDDDGNGFVDDYNGWNSGSNNDAIGAGGHGTSVSGMIGAVGNNGNGGAGVNWDVEIMQVDMGGGLTESNVIVAYNYPYTMRDLYNNTNGASGAFVVATNASWGIDGRIRKLPCVVCLLRRPRCCGYFKLRCYRQQQCQH